MLRVRIDEGNDPQPQLLWDSIWRPADGFADWAIAGPTEKLNRGGLQATQALHTAIILCLFSDKRCPDDHPLRKLIDDSDLRGWWGDGIDVRADLGETELGSLLWILERAPLDEEYRRWAEQIATEALAPLIAQGAAARIDVTAIAEAAFDRLDLLVQVYGRDGTQIYDYRFDDLWKQAAQ